MVWQLYDIASVIPSLYGGGIERIMVHLAGGFAERAMTVDLVLTQTAGDYLASVRGKKA
ncbi:MAG: hypothetical protein ACREUM_06350 [Nitrosospira sp.]